VSDGGSERSGGAGSTIGPAGRGSGEHGRGDASSHSAASLAAAGSSGGGTQDLIPPPAVSGSGGVRMRGRSFAEEVKELSSQCVVLQRLLERYTVSSGRRFEDVPAFLP
jgi:hypothetical protein